MAKDNPSGAGKASEWWVRLPDAAAFDESLSDSDVRLLLYVARDARKREPRCRASVRPSVYAQAFRITPQGMRKWLRRLAAAGWVWTAPVSVDTLL